jgi:O-antigen/teichoic acid export membrane protein
MMAQLSVPIRRIPGYLSQARSDSLVRNSLYLMMSTVVTAGLGYVFWGVAAHAFTSRQVGIASAVISLCMTTALLTYLGSFAMLIERLPGHEGSSRWTAVLTRISLGTAAVTAVVTAAAVPVLMAISHAYSVFFSSAPRILVAVAGATAWTLVNLLGSAFIAARRAGRQLCIQTWVSGSKLLFALLLAAAGLGAAGLVGAWTAGAALGVAIGAAWLVPRMGLGWRPSHRPSRQAAVTAAGGVARDRRPSGPGPPALSRAAFMKRLLAQHLTSVGGNVTPMILPVLVTLRLGVTPNAYFYITWMLGGLFLIVSPAVSYGVFAEGVRSHSELHIVVAKALRVIVIMLIPPMVVLIVGGKFILGLFGTAYAVHGYGLLVLLAAAALPDAVSNVAVAVWRVTHKLAYSTALNLSMLAATLGGAWVLMPSLGILGVGVAMLGVQILGAIASLPAYVQVRKPVILTGPTADGQPDAGIALLIHLAQQQSRDRPAVRLPAD